MPNRHHRNANAAPRRRKRPERGAGKRADWVSGTLVELNAEQQLLKIRVRRARRAQLRRDAELVVNASGAVFKAADADGDGQSGLTDLFPGDRLHVVLAPRAEGAPATALRITQRSPGGPVGGLRRVWRDRNNPGG
jgi:hypothetical protein